MWSKPTECVFPFKFPFIVRSSQSHRDVFFCRCSVFRSIRVENVQPRHRRGCKVSQEEKQVEVKTGRARRREQSCTLLDWSAARGAPKVQGMFPSLQHHRPFTYCPHKASSVRLDALNDRAWEENYLTWFRNTYNNLIDWFLTLPPEGEGPSLLSSGKHYRLCSDSLVESKSPSSNYIYFMLLIQSLN